METGTVTVTGRALVSGRPDEALLTLALRGWGQTHAEAMTDVVSLSDKLDALLDELGVDDGSRKTTGVSVREDTRYNSETKQYTHHGYNGSNNMSLRLRDPELVGKVMTQAAIKVAADISGPYWCLALTNPAHTEAHTAAATDAKRKAEAYAGALGARLGPVLRVADPGVTPYRRGRYMEDYSDNMVSASMIEPPDGMEIHTGSLDVSASVEVTFNLEPTRG